MDIKKLLCEEIKTEEEKEEFKLLIRKLSSYAKKEIRKFYGLFFSYYSYSKEKEEPLPPDIKEEAESEIISLLFEKRDYICSREIVTFSLLRRIVRNYFIDKARSLKSQKNFMILSLEEEINVNDTDDRSKPLTREDRIASPDLIVEHLLIEEYVSFLKENLTHREKETLCFEVFKVQGKSKENSFLSTLSDDARYQSWSRLKRKIRRVFSEELLEEISPKLALAFMDRVMSEICEKIVRD